MEPAKEQKRGKCELNFKPCLLLHAAAAAAADMELKMTQTHYWHVHAAPADVPLLVAAVYCRLC